MSTATPLSSPNGNPPAGASNHRLLPPGILWPFILLTSCFAWWGLANNMTDTLLAAFKRIKSMSDFQTSLIQIAFYGSYFCFALPAAMFIKRFSYKAGVLLGLALFIAGGLLFYPASLTMEYWHFLAALYILAGGLSILETAANPYVVVLGPEVTGTQRLNLAQSFNPIGSILGVLLSKLFILSELRGLGAEERAALPPAELERIQAGELEAVMGPYVAVSLVLLVIWILIASARMPHASDQSSSEDRSLNLLPAIGRLIRNRHYLWGVIAQFFYVGAQIGVWSFTIRYVMGELNLNEEQSSTYYLAALVLFSVARFVCTGLMSYFTPRHILTALAVLAIGCCLVTAFAGGYPGVIALVAISGCMSLMFPTIYGLAIRGLGDDTKIGGSGLIMAILGGAVITALQGQVSDATGNIGLSYLVPLACFVVIAYYALYESTKDLPKRMQATQ
ncbi:MAG: L-fucose:H+ symporter permease [Bryobacterales bacterium]|jgi:FHS family L-fucose permease-like MFS transporter|nr:L-fucose:H+ symporter permease [Bryobacterales bacterium]